mgnify:CR=1 FL=1
MLEQIVGNNQHKAQAMQELSGVAAQDGMMEGGQLIPSRIRNARLASRQVPAESSPAQQAPPQGDSLYGAVPHRFGQPQGDSPYGAVPHRFGQPQGDSLYGVLPHRLGPPQSESLYGPLPFRFGQTGSEHAAPPQPGVNHSGDSAAAAAGLGDANMPATGRSPLAKAAADVIPPGRVKELIRLFEGQY